MTKGKCPHGEFELEQGCPQCVAERAGGIPSQDDNKKPAPEQPETRVIVQIAPISEEAVVNLLNEALTIADKADAFTVASVEDIKLATNDLSIIATIKKKVEEKRREYTDPLLDHLTNIRNAFKTITEPIEYANKTLRSKVIEYQKEEERKIQEASDIAQLEREAEERKAKLEGRPVQAIETMPIPAEPNGHTMAELGTSSKMVIWKWELINKSLVPMEYMKLDEGAISRAVKASQGSMTIPGIRIYNEPTLRVETMSALAVEGIGQEGSIH
ncbi:hypothetical protein LCGC14_1035170 [marine sediment metagenome]|uniref:Uncharacterized protein n=1 Tax=marine sediment metagenome TaxID=412755 RepID=A0A0F9QZH5_9ZZZZ